MERKLEMLYNSQLILSDFERYTLINVA